MAKEGYPTACTAFYGLKGGPIVLDDIIFFPGMGSQWGDDAMIKFGNKFNADVVFTLQDIWVLQPQTIQQMAKDRLRWIPIVPIDHEPVPSPIHNLLKGAYRVVTYAPFGHRELKRVGMHSTYIPHTVETDLFKKGDRAELKRSLGIPEDFFLFGNVGANKDNPPRKSFNHIMDAFKIFHDKYPKSALYFHTNTKQEGGFDIDDYASVLGISNVVYKTAIEVLDANVPTEEMYKVYSAFDALLYPSANEGFGVPIIEAQACETPALVTDFTAMKDLVIDGETGFLIKVREKRYDQLRSWIAIPDVDDMVEKMEKMYLMTQKERDDMGKKARKFVEDNFNLPVVWKKHWVPFLEMLEEEIYGADDKN